MKVLIIGLGYGDEGKGTITDWFARSLGSCLITRFNGGPQAAHHVVTAEGLVHCFAQFGSGMLVPEAKTYLSRFMLVDPLSLIREDKALKKVNVKDAFNRLMVHDQCTVVTPYHKLIGRMREIARGKLKYGSCGLGVGEAATDRINPNQPSLILEDLKSPENLQKKLTFLWQVKLDQAEQLVDEHTDNLKLLNMLEDIKNNRHDYLFEFYINFLKSLDSRLIEGGNWDDSALNSKSILFEGSQGVLLDHNFGFAPYVTKTRTTFHNAFKLIESLNKAGKILRIGVLRSYATRHGNGPFISEDQNLQRVLPEIHNRENPWQGCFRLGWFDLVATRYALAIVGQVDALAITHIDRLAHLSCMKVCKAYKYHGNWSKSWNGFFDCEYQGNTTVIHALRFPYSKAVEAQELRAEILEKCHPLYHEFPNWNPLPVASKESVFTSSVTKYLQFLESKEGLGVPIAIGSFGLTSQDKIVWNAGILSDFRCSQIHV